MREVNRIDAAAIQPEPATTLRRIGIHDVDRVSPRVGELVDRAAEMFARLAAPVILFESVTTAEFADVYEGAGDNPPASPLLDIFPRADALALFAATLGGAIDRTIQDEFRAGDLALAYVLDAIASEAADRLASVAATRFLASTGAAATREPIRALPYSAGYCGWHVSGQRALFDRLRPAEIGIGLTEGCLMDPLKSVSGVLVTGPPAVHRFQPAFPFCEACVTHDCRVRMASVK
jgi:hypothetical protein